MNGMEMQDFEENLKISDFKKSIQRESYNDTKYKFYFL